VLGKKNFLRRAGKKNFFFSDEMFRGHDD